MQSSRASKQARGESLLACCGVANSIGRTVPTMRASSSANERLRAAFAPRKGKARSCIAVPGLKPTDTNCSIGRPTCHLRAPGTRCLIAIMIFYGLDAGFARTMRRQSCSRECSAARRSRWTSSIPPSTIWIPAFARCQGATSYITQPPSRKSHAQRSSAWFVKTGESLSRRQTRRNSAATLSR